MQMNIFKRIITHPLNIGIAILVVVLFLVSPDDMAFIRDTVGGGAIVKIVTALIAAFTLMSCVLLGRYMRVLFSNGEPNGISTNPIAKAILLSGMYLSFALVVSSVFG
jgi:hypothetical protein